MVMLSNGEIELVDDDETPTTSCDDCGTDVPTDEINDADGREVCDSCFDAYYACDDCGVWSQSDDMTTVANGNIVCESCLDNYSECDDCGERVSSDYINSVMYDHHACDGCMDNYGYCDSCGEYYSHDDGPCCSYDCGCVAPRQEFSFPVDGGTATISNDEHHHVTLAAGMISETALDKIGTMIREHAIKALREATVAEGFDENHSYRLDYQHPARLFYDKVYNLTYDLADAIGAEWAGERGNFTKRLGRHVYNLTKIALPADLLAEIGNIARSNSNGSDVNVAFTRDLNQSASAFFHAESCWWSDYAESRCSLKSNGGIGMRSFGDRDEPTFSYQVGPWASSRHAFQSRWVESGKVTYHNVVTGRAWIMPVNKGEREERHWNTTAREWETKTVSTWVPTFNSTTPEGYIVFNGYGALSNYEPARILAQMTGHSYVKVGFDCDPMYVNNGGYLVTDKDTIAAMTDDDKRITIVADTHSNLHTQELANA